MKSYLVLALVLLASLAGASIRGITLVPYPDANNAKGWQPFNSARESSIRDLHRIAGFTGVRFIVSDDLGPTVGLRDEAKGVLSLVRLAASEGYQQVVLAVMGDYSGCEASSPYYRPLALVCLQFIEWTKEIAKIKAKYPKVDVVESFNDIDLQDSITDVLTKGQALTSAKRAPRPPSAMIERNIMAATWSVNPNQRWVRQARTEPLGFVDPRVLNAQNAYVAAYWDCPKQLTWPMDDGERDAAFKDVGFVPGWQIAKTFNRGGLSAWATEWNVQFIPEFGLPDSYPLATHLAYAQDVWALGVDAYLFRVAPLWGSKGINKAAALRFAKLSEPLPLIERIH